MKVSQTLDFVTGTKTPKVRPNAETHEDYQQWLKDSTLDALGISHTKNTMVGNEYVRGVSGGERKRVSLAEVMATQVGSIRVLKNSPPCRRLTREISGPYTMLG